MSRGGAFRESFGGCHNTGTMEPPRNAIRWPPHFRLAGFLFPMSSDDSILKILRERVEARKVVVLGVGNPMRGDDGLGPALAERLQSKVRATVINAEEVPENYLGKIVAAQPQVVMIVDALDIGLSPGDVALVEVDRLGGASPSTHSASLSLCGQYLRKETQADVFLLGVQPLQTGLGAPLSPAVEATINLIENVLQQLLAGNAGSRMRDGE
jgi:hydrogenase 3 maturation protease